MGKLTFYLDGHGKEAYMGEYLSMCFVGRIEAAFNPIRQYFDVFDEIVLGKSEREINENCIRLRAFIQAMIEKRRESLKDSSFKNRGDFLTLMVQDEIFKDQDTYILDECITFMLASTMTTTLLITNSIFYLTKYPRVLEKLRKELFENSKRTSF